jgi:cardiolipin synthase
LNIPNLLTLSRFALIPIYIIIFSYGYVVTAFIVVLLAGLTDILDGHIARTKGQITEMGTMLDPLADKSMMLVVVISLLYTGMIPWEAAAAMFIRDIGMIIGSAFFHLRGKKTVPANMMGKITTVLYYPAILFIVFQVDFAMSYLWFVILFSFVTSTIYIVQFRSLNQEPTS